MKLTTKVRFSARDLALSSSGPEVVEFIKELDEAKGDWGVTLELIVHFDKLREQYLKECAADGEEPDPRVVLK
jgi:hypothetical protein